MTDAAGLDLDLLRDWLYEATERGLARTTIARRAAAARGYTAWLTRRGVRDEDPGARLRAPKTRRSLPRVVSATQAAELLADAAARAADGDPVALRDVAMLELLYASGIRVSELTGLDVDDIDRWRRTVRVLGKGGKERVVPYGGPAADALERWLRAGRPALLARGPAGRMRSPRRSSARRARVSRRGSCTASCRRCSTPSRAVAPRARTPCGTRPRRTCSTAAPTSARCRRCSAMRASAPRRSTRTSRPSA
ncbi:hypothetical protein GCM10025877_01450 [Agromyces mangrovi Wang et al. 2018]|nr:hypothetical protein GCM10025877_01450 [Agromyces mangrovi]